VDDDPKRRGAERPAARPGPAAPPGGEMTPGGTDAGAAAPGGERHVRGEHYVRTARGEQAPAVLAHLVHRHVLERCPVCRDEWRALSAERPRFRALLDGVAEVPLPGSTPSGDPPPPSRPGRQPAVLPQHLPGNDRDVGRIAAELERHKAARSRARRELWLLLRRPPERWAETVDRANTRYRSRAFAELLVETCREIVRTRPHEAERLAALVPAVLAKKFPPSAVAWSAVLSARAAAHRANALRVAGDLAAAARRFAVLRSDLAEHPLQDPAALAEIASLEASLAIGQRRFGEAEMLLDRAVLLYRHAGDRVGEARTLVKQGLALQSSGRPAEAVERLAIAAAQLNPVQHDVLLLSAANCRAACLCDLGRFEEARAFLQENLDLYEASDDLHFTLFLRGLQGRIALGLGNFDEAEEAFAASRDGLLAVDRTYDAALAALDLAHVFYEAGRSDDLRSLARNLLRTFRARGVSREALGALTLLARAAVADGITRELLAHLRRRLEAAAAPAPPEG